VIRLRVCSFVIQEDKVSLGIIISTPWTRNSQTCIVNLIQPCQTKYYLNIKAYSLSMYLGYTEDRKARYFDSSLCVMLTLHSIQMNTLCFPPEGNMFCP
jgi:hypothetical protein